MNKLKASDVRQILEDWMKKGLIDSRPLPETDEEFLRIDLKFHLGLSSLDEQELSHEIEKKLGISQTYHRAASDMFVSHTIRDFIDLFKQR